MWPVAKISLINVLTWKQTWTLTLSSVASPMSSGGQCLCSISRAILLADSYDGYKQRSKYSCYHRMRRYGRKGTRVSGQDVYAGNSGSSFLEDKWRSLFNKETSGESSPVISDYCCYVISWSCERKRGEGEIFRSYYASRLLESASPPS